MAPLNCTSFQPRHFLFMLPAAVTPAERTAITESARSLTDRGYVYIASPEERTMEDRGAIRYLPLHLEMLPCFGSVTAVCVLRDETLAEAARQAYPNTEVMVVDPLGGHHVNEADKATSSWVATSDRGMSGVSQAA